MRLNVSSEVELGRSLDDLREFLLHRGFRWTANVWEHAPHVVVLPRGYEFFRGAYNRSVAAEQPIGEVSVSQEGWFQAPSGPLD
jgi:hypothetical protein